MSAPTEGQSFPIYRLIERIGPISVTCCPEPPKGSPKYCLLDLNCQEIATAQTLEYARGEARRQIKKHGEKS